MSVFCCQGFLHGFGINKMYSTRHQGSYDTITSHMAIHYSVLDYGYDFDLKWNECVCGERGGCDEKSVPGN